MTLSGRILQLDLDGFKVAVNNLPVQSPHWHENGKRQPAAFAAGSSSTATVHIRLNEASDVAPMGVLTGILGTLSIRGRCRLAVGAQRVAAHVTGDPSGGFRLHVGEAIWSIQPDGGGGSVPLANRTSLEVFELLGRPAPFYSMRHGVWAEALRFLELHVGLTGVADQVVAVERVARFCHRDHALRYDVQCAANHFFGLGFQAPFKLSAYLVRAPRLANCFDQTAAVQALTGALGIPVRFLYLSPFGYLQVIDLLGVGPCNNPIFLHPTCNCLKQPVVNGTPRSFFGNHTFCELGSRVYDACVGPHVGVHQRAAYLSNLIDTTVPHKYGLSADILNAVGVSEVI